MNETHANLALLAVLSLFSYVCFKEALAQVSRKAIGGLYNFFSLVSVSIVLKVKLQEIQFEVHLR